MNDDKKWIIEDLAHFYWEEAGKPEGMDLDFWLKAENYVIDMKERQRIAIDMINEFIKNKDEFKVPFPELPLCPTINISIPNIGTISLPPIIFSTPNFIDAANAEAETNFTINKNYFDPIDGKFKNACCCGERNCKVNSEGVILCAVCQEQQDRADDDSMDFE